MPSRKADGARHVPDETGRPSGEADGRSASSALKASRRCRGSLLRQVIAASRAACSPALLLRSLPANAVISMTVLNPQRSSVHDADLRCTATEPPFC